MKPELRNDKDEAFQVLALHEWDALEAIRTVLAERDAIEERLRIATIAMGCGWPQVNSRS
ncbi:hypothetical protein [Shinella sumterensis]|uniref:Uncharacterized protein n=1 Tax=Shinella sumterensis TaxID=1967501 RepID=A0AA50CKP6_9HYPH|nr:hypothetical protein [Shinella sumterensis]WLR98655.1 hypothetical protein Q9313_06385 [Shinella sumterensis]